MSSFENILDPDQMASEEAIRSGSTFFYNQSMNPAGQESCLR